MARRTFAPSRPSRVPSLRRRVEAAGWRTWLAYRENHHRDDAGRLVQVECLWVAEAEHTDGRVVVCEASSPTQAWLDLAAAVRHDRAPVPPPALLAG
jgi:hypothetical protein